MNCIWVFSFWILIRLDVFSNAERQLAEGNDAGRAKSYLESQKHETKTSWTCKSNLKSMQCLLKPFQHNWQDGFQRISSAGPLFQVLRPAEKHILGRNQALEEKQMQHITAPHKDFVIDTQPEKLKTNDKLDVQKKRKSLVGRKFDDEYKEPIQSFNREYPTLLYTNTCYIITDFKGYNYHANASGLYFPNANVFDCITFYETTVPLKRPLWLDAYSGTSITPSVYRFNEHWPIIYFFGNSCFDKSSNKVVFGYYESVCIDDSPPYTQFPDFFPAMTFRDITRKRHEPNPCGLIPNKFSCNQRWSNILWTFRPLLDFVKETHYFEAVIFNITIIPTSLAELENNVEFVDLIHTQTIKNCDSGTTQTSELSQTISRTESSSITFSKSVTASLKLMDEVEVSTTMSASVKATLSGKIFGLGVNSDFTASGSATGKRKFGKERSSSKSSSTALVTMVSETKVFAIKKILNVGPLRCVKVSGVLKWMNDVVTQYTAVIKFRIMDKKTKKRIGDNQTRVIFQNLGHTQPLTSSEDGYLTYSIAGTIIGSIGLETTVDINTLPADECPCSTQL